jgi:ubiquinone biosynthesis protein COQ9
MNDNSPTIDEGRACAVTTTIDHQRDLILERALVHVAFEGWTERALRMAVIDAGFAPGAHARFFPGGVGELITHWAAWSDRRMMECVDSAALDALPVRERIACLVRVRIEVNAEHREAVRRALSYLALPGNGGSALRHVYASVDAIWYAAGDQATDFSFYTRRVTLAAVIAATLLFWLDDASDGANDTWAFLDRRLDDVMAIPRIRSRVGGVLRALNPARIIGGSNGVVPH